MTQEVNVGVRWEGASEPEGKERGRKGNSTCSWPWAVLHELRMGGGALGGWRPGRAHLVGRL